MMFLDFLNFKEYGIFIWPAFIFTFLSCFILYIKTKAEFEKHEKLFVSQMKSAQIKKIKSLEKIEAFAASPIL